MHCIELNPEKLDYIYGFKFITNRKRNRCDSGSSSYQDFPDITTSYNSDPLENGKMTESTEKESPPKRLTSNFFEWN